MQKKLEKQYQKKTQLEHILLRPDTYIGSTQNNKEKLRIYDDSSDKIIKKEIDYNSGLYKIFDEVIVNAADASQIDKKTKNIWVEINDKQITVSNDGIGIPVLNHPKENCTIPELIFGHFLTGSNFDDSKKRTTGGRNGFGAKLTNAYSSEFIVEINDSKNNKYFKQIFKNNMREKSIPIIEDKKFSIGLVKITFIPDFKKFNLKKISNDMIQLFKKRVYDICAVTNNKINVFYNNIKIEQNNFDKYISLYYDDTNDIIYEKINDYWEIGIVYKPDYLFEQISFVNSISTFNGGTHVKYITDMIIKRLEEILKKKNKDLKVKPNMFKDNLIIFINCLIDKPQFSSQTKEELKTKISEFGTTCIINDKIIKKLVSFGIIEQVINFIKIKEEMQIKKKTDGKKLSNIRGIPKLEDSNWAGTKKSELCTLIITEGDSAKALAMSGRTVVGNDKYGVFPLKGKLLNIREASAKQQLENEEIKNLKKILGLQKGKVYTKNNLQELRYSRLMILTDQDTDGFHIKGLIINWIHYEWPELLGLDFIISLKTPIIKATKGKIIKHFYSEPEFHKWSNNLAKSSSWSYKYYKGLGTSTSKEAKEYFTDIDTKLLEYVLDDKVDDNNINLTDKSIKLAFEKNKSNERKIWLENYSANNYLDYNIPKVYFSDFIDKELKLFSRDNVVRSIPSIIDGCKESNRKVLHAAFQIKPTLYNKKNEIKIAQLSGYVANITNYHHGENSLQETLINMAQNYVGSNNINLLNPSGQFGTRLEGGKDHASPRYIFTFLEELTKYIFREEDECILNYLKEDGMDIEPENYYPIVPMILINGTEGIGTGYSTFIPKYNPLDIIDNIINIMENKPIKEMNPWYKNYKGKIKKKDSKNYNVIGKYNVIDDNSINVIELPIGMWSRNYKDFLESIEINKDDKKGIIDGYNNNSSEVDINFILNFPKKKVELFIKNDTLENKLKLIKNLKITNMHLFNNNKIQKFENPEEILEVWYNIRLEAYIKRKKIIINKIEQELPILKYKKLFIEYILDDKIIINKQKKMDIIKKLKELKFPIFSNGNNTKNYDYLTSMQLFSLTEEKIQELNKSYNDKLKDLNNLKEKKEIDIWKYELIQFKKKYLEWLKNL